MAGQFSSQVTRVRPIFAWLCAHGGPTWPARLVKMAGGVADLSECGSVVTVDLDPEREVPPTPERLSWMIENADRLAPLEGELWNELRRRVADRDTVQQALASLREGKPIPRDLVLEGNTHCDCLIECEHALIWIEGKRFDWLSPSIKWDVSRDQLARDVEAAWSLARPSGKDYRVILCHEHPLKHHETALLDGYRRGTWSAGWPHVADAQRREFSTRIGTLTWARIAQEWPALRKELPQLADLS